MKTCLEEYMFEEYLNWALEDGVFSHVWESWKLAKMDEGRAKMMVRGWASWAGDEGKPHDSESERDSR
jgi:hypothetical protein